jgi:hypothetical protein
LRVSGERKLAMNAPAHRTASCHRPSLGSVAVMNVDLIASLQKWWGDPTSEANTCPPG